MKYKKSVYRSLTMVTQLGFCVLTPVFLGIFAGSYLDSRYGTHLTLVFLILGVLGGGRGAYAMAKRLIDQDAKEARIEKEEHWKKALSDSEGGVDRPKTKSRIFKPESDRNPDCSVTIPVIPGIWWWRCPSGCCFTRWC